MMSSECSECDAEAVATLVQQPFCEEHAQERLEELEEKREVLEAEVDAAQKEYDRLKNKYDVDSFGHIEHQLNVEEREDIDESDVQAVNDAEGKLAAKQHELSGIEEKIKDLKADL